MSEELTLKRGTAAEELLGTEAFTVAVNELYNQYLAAITMSGLGDKEKREQAFYQLRALQDVTAELQGWIHAKDQLLTPTEE
jgi:hypothetical protein